MDTFLAKICNLAFKYNEKQNGLFRLKTDYLYEGVFSPWAICKIVG